MGYTLIYKPVKNATPAVVYRNPMYAESESIGDSLRYLYDKNKIDYIHYTDIHDTIYERMFWTYLYTEIKKYNIPDTIKLSCTININTPPKKNDGGRGVKLLGTAILCKTNE
ncbi:MAG: hypothetical protein JJT94_04120 [Bernardetiaceae bacterium]|nr:hypothetical protein [Bernardetiaceae bacterium]